jgi:hypothetical protein
MATPKAWLLDLDRIQRFNRAVEDRDHVVLDQMAVEAKERIAKAELKLGKLYGRVDR